MLQIFFGSSHVFQLNCFPGAHELGGEGAGEGSRPPKNKKKKVFGQKINAIRAKINHTNFIRA